MHLGLMFWATGTHAAGWRYPGSRADGAYDIGFIQDVTRLVEDAKFDFLFLGDRLFTDPALAKTNPAQMSRLEPFTAASAIAAATSKIGIVATANPTYYDPYNLARLLASLDHLSHGRASWNLVTGADAMAASNFSRSEHWETEKRYDWADEFVDVVRALWDSWEDDAFVTDPVRGVYVDESKIHPIDHHGPYFDVTGPLNVARPPQGQVVLLHAGTSDRSRELGAREADVIFAAGGAVETAREYYADVKGRAARYGRAPDQIHILPSLSVIVAETRREALAIRDRLDDLLPLAEDRADVRAGSLGQATKRRDDWGITGDPSEVADYMQEWFETGAADGFNIFPPFVPGSVQAFTELVVPELRRRGLYRTEYTGGTFRDHLGLVRPQNRFEPAAAKPPAGPPELAGASSR